MGSKMQDAPLPLLIDGRHVTTDGVLETRDPTRPTEVVARFAEAGPAEVEAAYAAARAAQPAWAGTSAVRRSEILLRAAELVEERAESIGRELTREEGKTLPEAVAEVRRSAAILRFHAGDALQPHGALHPSANAETFLYTVREPVGVVGLITPWNFPIAIPAWKLAPALVHGNTVVLKPASEAPLPAYRLAECLLDAGLPDGVLNVVCGRSSQIGSALIDDPELDAVSFTGSTAVGQQIRRQATDRGVKVQLELGGNNALVVLDDADVDRAVACTVGGAMHSTGQKCTATRRVIVEPGIYDVFVAKLLAAVGALRVGDPLDPESDLGPLASEVQFREITGYFEIAREEGQHVGHGGRAQDREGWFVEPTVYLDVDPDSRIGQEEIFGPVLSVIRARDAAHAREIADGTAYGLSASVFTRDLGRAFAFARAARVGVVHINSETTGSEPQVPFGGIKASGSDHREQGKAAAEFFTALKTVYVDAPQEGS